ncbi:hypothetical protein IWQ57_002245 [Coemansia nantahalensis]|uniref:Uncharacterized protein n=1 Tax=Coemansia nantahalensis TaxID=2789366 RepID=A0ACC1K1F1_9FUNG|nr:hypothetical protein IWQ57_002245 [Coemansia nantahalensis]
MSPAAMVASKGPGHVDTLLAKQGKADRLQLRRRVEFRLATQSDAKMDLLRTRYKPINGTWSAGRKGGAGDAPAGAQEESTSLEEASGFRRAAHSLFPAERLAAGWRKMWPIGPGLNNLGNTCFLNSVLQCLTYTPPLAEYMLSREHSAGCRAGDNCMLCKFEMHVVRALSKRDGTPISPKSIVGRLRLVAKHMRVGRQEDAHEFLRLLVDAFQRSLLAGIDPKIDRRIQETTLTSQIFGGYLQSQVSCGRCGHDSNTFDPLLDLSLDIQAGSTIAKALRSFTRPEILSKGNRYKCEKCTKLVDATKQMTIYQLPRILTLQLKRFSVFGGKIGRHVEFPLSLDMAGYVSKNSSERGPQDYRLYAVLVHAGGSSRSGHYYCFVKSPAGIWHELNDSTVRQVSERTVLQQSAYVLFYERRAPRRAEDDHKKKAAHKAQLAAPEKLPEAAPKQQVPVVAASDDMEASLAIQKMSLQSERPDKSKTKVKHKKAKREGAKEAAVAAAEPAPTPAPAPAQPASPAVPDASGAAWVVRDKAPAGDEAMPSAKPAASSVPVIAWDEDTASKRSKAKAVAETAAAGSWSVADISTNRTSQYGAQVESWAGGVSAGIADKAKKRQRRPDKYDAEYDRGRAKKVKKNKRNRFASAANPFQLHAERVAGKRAA